MDYGYASEGFFDAVYLQFKKVAEVLDNVSEEQKEDALDHLYGLCHIASGVGYGLEGDMRELLAETNPDDECSRVWVAGCHALNSEQRLLCGGQFEKLNECIVPSTVGQQRPLSGRKFNNL